MEKKTIASVIGGAAIGGVMMFAVDFSGYLIDFCTGVVDNAPAAVEAPADPAE